MTRLITTLIVFGSAAILLQACATKGFVREQVGSTEGRLAQRADTTENQLRQTSDQLRQTSDRTAANTQALEATGQRVQGLDTRLGEVATTADGAKRDVATVATAQKEAEEGWRQRFANRNKLASVDQKVIYFDFGKAELKDEGINELAEVARALQADPNAVLELQGFADSRGSDRYNYQLTRERVDTVTRYLVQKHGVDLRRIYAVGMGKVAPAAGEKQSRDTLAKSRRVEIRVLGPQS
jgi:outer membrane protein OmpA-like peptidoglycan-associated protein